MKYTCFFPFLLLFLSVDHAHSQDPLPAPRIFLVTVGIESQLDSIIWYAIPFPFDPLMDYYIIAELEDPYPGQPQTYYHVQEGVIDTFYVNNNLITSTLEEPIGYVIWGAHPKGDNIIKNGDLSKPDSTMYLETDFDSCSASITLTWNDYNQWRGSTAGFTIKRRTGPGAYIALASVIPDVTVTRYTHVLDNVMPNETYDLFVEAANTDGIRRSNTNRAAVFTKMAEQTGEINADYATISPSNTIELSFTVRGAEGQDKYRLLRSDQQGGGYEVIDSVTTSDTILHFIDATPFTSGIYYYKLEMINNCNCMHTESNLANNIILSGTQSGSSVSLAWNKYSDWSGGVERYRVVRTVGQTSPFTDTLDGGISNVFTDDLSVLLDYTNPASSHICYYIDALEGANMNGTRGRSISNRVCITVNPDIRMPDAFIPNDGEPVNRVFEPVFSFIPEHYELIIFNRLGTKIWEGNGPWDGMAAGKPVPEGVYLYLLRIYNYSSDMRELNGKVVVVYR